ncbi:MAG: CPBP family intramembrane glutamic endopeptidase [Candidatus Cybelea sp.]
MKKSWLWPLGGTLAAIAVTSTMDATGLSAFSALPLFALLIIFAYAQRFSLQELGFRLRASQAWRSYAVAMLYPVFAMTAIAAAAAAGGALHAAPAAHSHRAAWENVLIVTAATIPVALVTEEGFFRGWLWASLLRAGAKPVAVLGLTSVAFALWHWSSVLLPTGFNPPIAQVPAFMLNAVALGLIWGLLRSISRSLLVSSVSHGIWNGLAYVLFGYGSHVGALGISNTAVFAPETGLLGVAVNAAGVAALWAVHRTLIRRPHAIA